MQGAEFGVALEKRVALTCAEAVPLSQITHCRRTGGP